MNSTCLYAKRVGAGHDSAAPPWSAKWYLVKIEIQTLLASRKTMGDYGWSMDSDTPQGIDAVEYGRVLEYPKRRNKSQRAPGLPDFKLFSYSDTIYLKRSGFLVV